MSSLVFIDATTNKLNESLKGPPIDSNQLMLIADILLDTYGEDRTYVLGAFNACAARISWGVLPQAGSLDVFAKYREAGLITWLTEAQAAA